MPSYIEAGALLKELNDPDIFDTYNDYSMVFDTIDNFPTADVAPVRHGYWCKEKRDVLIHWHCSVCKECFYLDIPNAEYCPHCGAKMDEESEKNAKSS